MAGGRAIHQKGTEVTHLIERLEVVYGRPRRIARFEPMDELVSCILSQHTSDVHSFPAFTRLKVAFPEWSDVVEAGPDRLADVIRHAGLANQKSKNIIACLSAIYSETQTYSIDFLRQLPSLEARNWLMKLPGVGPKTASIVLCFAMGRETIPVDTHVYRVSWRVGLIPEDLGEVKAHDRLLAIVPPHLAFRYHTNLIQHGRVSCKAPLPNCDTCGITDICRWYRKGGPEKKRVQAAQARRNGNADNRSITARLT